MAPSSMATDGPPWVERAPTKLGATVRSHPRSDRRWAGHGRWYADDLDWARAVRHISARRAHVEIGIMLRVPARWSHTNIGEWYSLDFPFHVSALRSLRHQLRLRSF